MKNVKKLFTTLLLGILLFTLFSFTSLRPIIGWGDWICSQSESGGLCWKNCHRTYYFFFAVNTEHWSGPCWQSPASVASLEPIAY
jgi:hypothetical protein